MDLAWSTIKIFGSKVANAIISFVAIAFFARELGAGQLGSFFLFQALLGILAIPADFGIRGAVEKRISEGKDPDAVLTTAVLLKFVPLSLIVVGIVLFQGVINEYIGASLALYLGLTLVLQECAMLMVSVLRGELRVGETATLISSRQAVWAGVAAVLVLSGSDVRGLIAGLIAGFSVVLILGAYKISPGVALPTERHARSLFDYSKYNFISSVGGYFYNWMDVAIIGLFLTQADVGVYEIAWRVTAIMMLFSQSIATTIFPQVSEWDAVDATDRIEKIISNTITPSLFLLIPAFFGSVLFSREILGVIFGAEYTTAWLVLIVLMMDKVFQGIQVIIGRSLQAINRPDLSARAAVVSIISNLLLNLVLIDQFGIIGAAAATVISSLINDILHAFYLSRFLSIRFPFQEVCWCVISSMVMALFLLLQKSVVDINSIIGLGVAIFSGGAIYFTVVFTYSSFRYRAIFQLRSLLN